ncbi:MAG TPA: phosphatidylserine decarboxylase family protein [Desulfurivibrio alkaliphilus]|uniref:Phosphatidylserine decarboxylase proenzyme n=1 Tax=Desulfurivibrio alkaliphilus TaxID=427923 RepID=A0A7C2TKR7_9BACT|nr:phosphatidylserine decarboxylase family protein [Desulfurivibrio alkaliphilus]
MLKPRIPVALEGWPFILLAGFATLLAAILGFLLPTLLLLALTIFILWFFRDPERVSPPEDDVLVSPADGKVILIERIFDERFVKDHVYKVSIFMNIFNVHVNRFPFPGRVERIVYTPGAFYSADSVRGALKNESCGVVADAGNGRRLAVVQVAGLIARRIVCWTEAGDQLGRGQRFGLIRFGSRVDLYLPLATQLEVKVGHKVKAGESVLGYLA